MISEKEVEELSKSAIAIGVALDVHPINSLNGIFSIYISPNFHYERKSNLRRCRQWLFDNQHSFPFSITKDMVH